MYAYVASNPLGSVDYLGLVKNIIHPTDEVREVCQYIFWCAKFLVVEMETDIGNRFKAYQYLEGYQGYKNNCHSYGLGLPEGIWLDNPNQVLKDEYHKVISEEEADILVFKTYNKNTGKYTYNHTSIVKVDVNVGKNGIWPKGKDPKIFHPFGEKIFYRKNNHE